MGRFDGPLDDEVEPENTGDAVLTEHQKQVRGAAKAAQLEAEYGDSIKTNVGGDTGAQAEIQARVAAQGEQAEHIKKKSQNVGCLAHVCGAVGSNFHLRACLL